MSAAVLLNLDDPTYDFHHAMQHRAYYQFMAPLHDWSGMPYFISPAPIDDTSIPAGPWHLNHQQAHNDYRVALPSDWDDPRAGIPTIPVLMDNDLSDEEDRSWFQFVNHQEHYIANATVLPAIPQAQTILVDLGGGLIIQVVVPPPWIAPARWTLPPFW